MSARTYLIFAALVTWSSRVSAGDSPQGEVTPLEVLVADAIADYPAILAEWAQVEALRTQEAQVDVPFDPMASVAVNNLPIDSFAFNRHGMTGVMVSLRESFYWPGVLNARAAEARAGAEARRADIPETAVRIWMSAVEPYYAIVDGDRALGVLEARRDVLRALRDAARARYEARAVPLTDVFRVETQLSRVEQDIAAVMRGRRIAAAQLNGLLNRALTTPVSTDPSDHLTPLEGSLEDWVGQALENRPAFSALEAQERLVQAQRRRAEAEDDPMWSVELGYMLRFQDDPEDSDLVTLMLGISLPLFSPSRTASRLAELSARSSEIDLNRHELIRGLRAEIGTHLEAMASIEDEIATLEGVLIPSVQSSHEGALAHYSSSHVSIETLIEIQDRLLELELARSGLVTMHDMHRATLRSIAVDSEAIRQIIWSEP